jgi:glycosyltransferase involved in cell wall biosynthesis
MPDVSLVFETENEQEHRHIRLADSVAAWRHQTARFRILEWILVSTRQIRAEEKRMLSGLPYSWLVRSAAYYEQKNAGIAKTRGRFIALADADDRPDLDWLEQALAAMERAPDDVAVITGRTSYEKGPFSREMTIAHFPFQSAKVSDVLSLGAGDSLFRADVLQQLLFEGDHIRHGADVDLAHRMRDAGYRVVYDPRLHITHNYTDRIADLWDSIAAKGHAFEDYAVFRGRRRRGAVIDAIGRYRVLLARLLELRRAMEVPVWRLPLSAAFFFWYVVAAGYGYGLAARGKPAPAYRF